MAVFRRDLSHPQASSSTTSYSVVQYATMEASEVATQFKPLRGTFPLLELPTDLHPPILSRLDRGTLFRLVTSGNRALTQLTLPLLRRELDFTLQPFYAAYVESTTGPRALPENPFTPEAKRIVWSDVATNRMFLSALDESTPHLRELCLKGMTIPHNWVAERFGQLGRSLRVLELHDGVGIMGFDELHLANTLATTCTRLVRLEDHTDGPVIPAKGWVLLLEKLEGIKEAGISIVSPRDLQPVSLPDWEAVGGLLATRNVTHVSLRLGKKGVDPALRVLKPLSKTLGSLALHFTDPVEPPKNYRQPTASAADTAMELVKNLELFPNLKILRLSCTATDPDASRTRTELSSTPAQGELGVSKLASIFPACLVLENMHVIDLSAAGDQPWNVQTLHWEFPDLGNTERRDVVDPRPAVLRALSVSLPRLKRVTLKATSPKSNSYNYW